MRVAVAQLMERKGVGESLWVTRDKGAGCCGTERVKAASVSWMWSRNCSDASAEEGVRGCDERTKVKCCLLKWAVGVMKNGRGGKSEKEAAVSQPH